ncbi:glycoside hydrolase family 2 protein [Flexithrix dorotheae]|uniref:glycoside hydrolase family 2 protein n=1 Tax=Flexithrix dorotheae TaxID=70993 RepID=UPI000380E09B|nr:glycoside hydrolase family 2 [Flexithrix dorotheae]
MIYKQNTLNKFKQTYLVVAIGLMTLISSCTETSTVHIKETKLTDGWQIIAAAEIEEDGKQLTSGESPSGNWVETTVPTTIMGALTDAGVYKDPFFGDNLAKIPTEPFENPWWFKKEFNIDNFQSSQEELRLFIDGINYRANIWLNGQQIASQDTLFGAFRQFEIDITDLVKANNSLAFEIIPPKARDFYMGFVDWAPTPPDKYMGIYREVRLKRTGKVALDFPFVQTDVDTKTLKEARLSIGGELTNFGKEAKEITIQAAIENTSISKNISLKPNEHIEFALTSDEFEELIFQNPRLWWPNGLGDPNMYELTLKVFEGNTQVDEQTVDFGIRSFETYLNEKGVRAYKVNGRDVLQKSGGWVDDLFLRYMPEKDAAQIRYVKEMNMNALRFEGVWGNNHHIYDLCDQNGILLMVGWSCQWEWPDYLGLDLVIAEGDENLSIAEGTEIYGVKITEEEEILLSDYFKDQVKWLRNHPSIYCWAVGSDAMPKPSLEKRYQQTLDELDPDRSLLVSAGEFTSTLSGPSGMKMNGPYEYVPPVYWYEDTKLGGAFGYNSETGPGPQIPPVESIKKMIPEDKLWPAMNDMWNYHSGRKDFNSVAVYMKALDNKYGKPENLDELALKAQLMNYEAMRPMFEAFVVNRDVATGVVQWMLNSPWPEFYWQLYDYYLMPTGAYFGTQKAGQAATLIFNYHNNQIYASNDAMNGIENYQAEIKLYDTNSNVVFQDNKMVSLGENDYKSLLTLPELKGKREVYFLDLKLKNASGKLVADNFYWLASQKDLMAWDQHFWFYTPQKQYADFTKINDLKKVGITVEKEIVKQGEEWEVNVTLSNPSENLAFFLELNAVKKSNETSILPVFWSDNYISLPPGESKTINLKFYGKDLSNDELQINIQGINLNSKIKI